MAAARKTPGSIGRATSTSTAIDTECKRRPHQSRGQDTVEEVLATAGRMLTTIGFEQLTTNGICADAGITPPALYRYFPNKYAILRALGERLRDAQDAAVASWMSVIPFDSGNIETQIFHIVSLQRKIIAATAEVPGGAAINRAIRAIPVLSRLHEESRHAVTERLLFVMRARFRSTSEARLRVAARLVAELSSAIAQMVVDDRGRDNDGVIYEAAYLIVLYLQSFKFPPPTNMPKYRRH